jgi:hypothetical protein
LPPPSYSNVSVMSAIGGDSFGRSHSGALIGDGDP